MLKGYKYRLNPTEDQIKLIEQTFGCSRLVYNVCLQTKIWAYKDAGIKLSSFDLCYQLAEAKKEYPWMQVVDSQALQAAVKKVDIAFKNFFRNGGFPKFKGKSDTQSFQCPNNTRKVDFEKGLLTIPKIKDIPIVISRTFSGKIKTITISRSPTGKYFASILVDDGVELPELPVITKEKSVGLDTGVKSFVISSNGKIFEANRKLKANLTRLRVLSRRASNKKKGSKNRNKANKRLAALHEKITNKRLDYIHKVTRDLTSDNQAISTIFVEDLNVSGLLSNHKIAQAMSDASLGKFYEILKYKCKWNGINLVKIGRFEPCSKRCSFCGSIKKELKLSEREWTCETCNTSHDRDINAAKNILWYGLQQTIFNNTVPAGSWEEPVEQSALMGCYEAGSQR
ncbi:MAG TPA: RNA-guided endonuclease TnpB family protein [Puia sp.]|jgi:putative transposase|nr:RNA-guided endonuclease TnpB family protein [Puia sp.]